MVIIDIHIRIVVYGKYDVKRGLRDINGKGVLAGLTQVSNVKATKIVDGKEVPCAGSLSYRGYDIKELTKGFIEDDRYGFEEVTYLLLFGKLPDKKQLADFTELLADQRSVTSTTATAAKCTLSSSSRTPSPRPFSKKRPLTERRRSRVCPTVPGVLKQSCPSY